MGEMIQLTASDGVRIGAYRAIPAGAPRGGVVILKEIFGVNAHIRSVADRYAAAGYLAIAPALFDRVEPDVELGYDDAGRTRGFALVSKVDHSKTPLDIEAAIVQATLAGKVGVVGFCWGGTNAFHSACHLAHVAAAVGYYGGGIVKLAGDTPKAPVMLHFGELDDHIPMSDVARIKAAHPDVPVWTYPAGHGFNRDGSSAYHEPSAALARERTLAFLAEHVG